MTRSADKGNVLMPRKPSYEELEQRVKELEEEALEHKQVEERLRRHANELNQELRQFAYVASHDLQKPLDVVTRYLRFVEARYKGRLHSDADEFIASAVDGAKMWMSGSGHDNYPGSLDNPAKSPAILGLRMAFLGSKSCF